MIGEIPTYPSVGLKFGPDRRVLPQVHYVRPFNLTYPGTRPAPLPNSPAESFQNRNLESIVPNTTQPSHPAQSFFYSTHVHHVVTTRMVQRQFPLLHQPSTHPTIRRQRSFLYRLCALGETYG